MVVIRDMAEPDLAAVARLSVQLWDEAPSARSETGEPWIGRLFADMMASSDVYYNRVAVDGGDVVGFMSVIFYRSFLHKVGTAQVNELIVDSGHRGSGVGRQLLTDAIEEARRRKIDEIEVSTSKDNSGAISFYKRAGLTDESVLLGRELEE